METFERNSSLARLVIYISQELRDELREASHAARLPVSVYCREVLAGRVPPPAPPVLDTAGQQLLGLLGRLSSNLTQLHRHAVCAGDPLVRLAQRGGELEQIRQARDRLAAALETGRLQDVADWSARLDPIGRAINTLAARLNRDESVAPAEWRAPLVALHRVFSEVGDV